MLSGERAVRIAHIYAFPSGEPEFRTKGMEYKLAPDNRQPAPGPSNTKPPFIVVAVPADAKVELLNSRLASHRWVPLVRHKIWVSVSGYET